MYLPYRRFLNLVVQDLENSIYSLHRVNISMDLFNSSTKNMERCDSLPTAEIHFDKPPIFSTAMSGSRILFADSIGRAASYDTSINSVATLPRFSLSKGPNSMCFSTRKHINYRVFRSLYVMDLLPGAGKKSSFEVISYEEENVPCCPPILPVPPRASYWCDLPLPPFLGNPSYQSCPNMFSSTVVDNKTLCVSSSDESLGTYSFDTQSRVWSQAGKWVLPFYGKAEYVPELNLWFGLSRKSTHCLCGFDLSTMDHDQPPELQHTWDYLDPLDLPEPHERHLVNLEPYERHLVNLGLGRFCMVSFFKTDEDFAVFTGVQLEPCNSAEATVNMIKHRSKLYSFKGHRIEFVL